MTHRTLRDGHVGDAEQAGIPCRESWQSKRIHHEKRDAQTRT